MSGARWTTGIGIALGGVGGAVAALLGAPARPAAPPVLMAPFATPSSNAASEPTAATVVSAPIAQSEPSVSPPAPANTGPQPDSAVIIPAALELPQTAAALMRAQVLCDRKKQYDECSRTAEALEKGTAGVPADPVQGKRFRKIALTYLVAECEAGDPHACFIMADKHRTGIELKPSPVRAAALQARALELCRLRRAPECPAR